MFKKDHDIAQRSKSHMKNKEVRKLKKDLIDAYPSLTDAQIGDMLMEKGNVTITKLASKSLVYSMENIPYFFDLEGRNNFWPTVFALWRAPHILRNVVIHPPVSSYILKGADLMAPGIITIEGWYD
jgi:translation initiation factor 2D